MDKKTTFFIWFLIIAVIIDIVGWTAFNQLNKIIEPLQHDIPKSLEVITKESGLNSSAQFIRYYDEVLTQSARNYVFTQDKKWKIRYRENEPQLDDVIKGAFLEGDEIDSSFFASIDVANLALVEMEYRAIDLVDKGKINEAIAILEGDEYWKQKDIYEKGLRDYVARRGVNYNDALIASTEVINKTVTQAGDVADTSRTIILVLILIGLIISIFLLISVILNFFHRNE